MIRNISLQRAAAAQRVREAFAGRDAAESTLRRLDVESVTATTLVAAFARHNAAQLMTRAAVASFRSATAGA